MTLSAAGAMPKLRFLGFDEVWISVPMRSLYSFKPTNTLSRDKLNYEQGEIRNIHYGDIHSKFSARFILSNENVPFVNNGEVPLRMSLQSFCEAGDMVLADASEDLEDVGKSIEIIELNDERVVAGLHTILARRTGDELIIGFGGYLFGSAAVRRQIKRESQGAKVFGISQTRLGDVLLAYPDKLGEQKKIADCLSSLDACIGAETHKLDALKAHKQGLMQQLFPAEGQRLSLLRFPEFREESPWDVRQLSEVSPSIFDGTHQTPIYTDEGVPFFSVENIVSGNKNKFISVSDHVVATRKNKPERGDILVTRIGIIGYSVVVNWDYEFSIYVTLAVIKQSPSVDAYFLHAYFQSVRYQTELQRKSLLNAVPCKINMEELRKTEVLLPEIDEQNKIAACLSSLDDVMVHQSRKIAALHQHKMGLMQGLFPAALQSATER